MKTSEALAKFGATIEYIDRPQDGFSSGGHYQPYPEQCPILRNGELFLPTEDGGEEPMTFVKGRSDDKGNVEIVFGGEWFFWTWNENSAENGWTSAEEEPSDDECQFLGNWEKQEA